MPQERRLLRHVKRIDPHETEVQPGEMTTANDLADLGLLSLGSKPGPNGKVLLARVTDKGRNWV